MTRRNGSRNPGNANRNVVRLKSQRAARRDSREDTHSVGTRHCPFALRASCSSEGLCALCVDIPNHFGSQEVS